MHEPLLRPPISPPFGRPRALPESSGHVIARLGVDRVGEDPLGVAVFDELPQVHEGGVVGNPRRLLHVVGHDHDRVLAAQQINKLFDPSRGDGIQSRAGFVHEEHLGVRGNRPGDAEALLLPPR